MKDMKFLVVVSILILMSSCDNTKSENNASSKMINVPSPAQTDKNLEKNSLSRETKTTTSPENTAVSEESNLSKIKDKNNQSSNLHETSESKDDIQVKEFKYYRNNEIPVEFEISGSTDKDGIITKRFINLGFSLGFPKTWEGRCIIELTSNSANIIYKPNNKSRIQIAKITSVSKDFNRMSEDDSILITDEKGKTYMVVFPTQFTYSEENKDFEQVKKVYAEMITVMKGSVIKSLKKID